MKTFFYCTLAFSTLLFSKSALAAGDWQKEVESLREDVRVLQRQVYRGETDGAKSKASAGRDISSVSPVNLSEYDDALRKINGRLDVLEYNVRQVEEKLDKFNRDFNIRFKILEGRQVPDSLSVPVAPMPVTYDAPVAKGAARSVVGDSIVGNDLAPIGGEKPTPTKIEQSSGLSATGSVVVDGAPQSIIPESAQIAMEKNEAKAKEKKPLSVDEMYASGMEAMNSGYPDEAEIAFKHILKEFPKNKLAGNAQYWLGDIYYKQGDLNKAKVAFKDVYEKYRNGNKAPDSLFKLGLTLKSLNNKKSACIVFLSFQEEFPKANADLKKKVKREISSLGCK